MNVRPFLVLCTAALLPGIASAAAPGAQLLGGAQALADYCSRVDPAHAHEFGPDILAALGIAKTPEDMLEAARRDPEYRSSYALFQSVFNQDNVAFGKRVCETIVTHGVPDPRHDDKHDTERHGRER